MRRLPAGTGERSRAGQHRRPPGELRRGGAAAGADPVQPGGRLQRRIGGSGPAHPGLRRGAAGGGMRRGRAHPAGCGQGAAEAGPGPPG